MAFRNNKNTKLINTKKTKKRVNNRDTLKQNNTKHTKKTKKQQEKYSITLPKNKDFFLS